MTKETACRYEHQSVTFIHLAGCNGNSKVDGVMVYCAECGVSYQMTRGVLSNTKSQVEKTITIPSTGNDKIDGVQFVAEAIKGFSKPIRTQVINFAIDILS